MIGFIVQIYPLGGLYHRLNEKIMQKNVFHEILDITFSCISLREITDYDLCMMMWFIVSTTKWYTYSFIRECVFRSSVV